jgi:hypothetical protein
VNKHYRNLLLDSFFAALDGGFIWAYFVRDEVGVEEPARSNGKNTVREKDLRDSFAKLRQGKPDVMGSLIQLNGFTEQRFNRKDKHLDELAKCFDRLIASRGRQILNRTLFGTKSESAPNFCEIVVRQVISDLRDHVPKANQPYSLCTKFLHFFRPKLFPIYDDKARHSWIAIVDRLELPGFRKTNSKWGHSNGVGYNNVCRFYRLLYDGLALSSRIRVSEKVNRIHKVFHFDFGMLDALDKFCWLAAGNEKFLFNYVAPHKRSAAHIC